MTQVASQQNLVELLGQLGGMLTSSLNLKENIDFMLQATSRMVSFDAASVFLIDDASEELYAFATYPSSDQVHRIARFKVGEGIVGWAVQSNEVVSIPDALQDA